MAAPGRQRGSVAASDSHTLDQSGSSPGVISRGMAGRPTVWVSTCRSVAEPLPCTPNSGQEESPRRRRMALPPAVPSRPASHLSRRGVSGMASP